MKLDNTQFKAGIASSKKEVSGLGSSLDALVRGGALTYMTRQAMDMAKAFLEAADYGAQLKETEGVFLRIAGGANKANRIIADTRSATSALTKGEMATLANRLELVGIGVEKLPRLAAIAESISDATGESVKSVMDQLISGTARSSDRMLKLIGINVQFEEGMSDSEKQAQFLNQVLSQGADIMGRLGDNANSAADKMDRAKTVWADWMDQIKKDISGPVATWFGWMMAGRDVGIPTGPKSMWSLVSKMWGGGSTSGTFDDMGTADARGGGSAGQHRVSEMQRAAVAAQQAAKAYFDALLQRGSSRTMGGVKSMGGYDSPATIDQGDVAGGGLTGPGTEGLKGLQREVNITADLVGGLGDAFAGLFEFLVTDSANAGKAFFAGIASSVSSVMSRMGDMLIFAGIGVESLKMLHGFAAIAAGIALKSVAGLFRGVASNIAPVSNSFGERHLRQPLMDSSKGNGSLTVIVEGDFVGDKAWVQRLMQQIRGAQRMYGTPIFVNKSGATT